MDYYSPCHLYIRAFPEVWLNLAGSTDHEKDEFMLWNIHNLSEIDI